MTHVSAEQRASINRRGRQENPADILKHFRQHEQLTQDALAHIMREKPITISRWERRAAKPRPQAAAKARRLVELAREARGVLTPEAFKTFLVRPHRLLIGLAPVDMLDNDRAFERVLDVIHGMQASDAV